MVSRHGGRGNKRDDTLARRRRCGQCRPAFCYNNNNNIWPTTLRLHIRTSYNRILNKNCSRRHTRPVGKYYTGKTVYRISRDQNNHWLFLENITEKQETSITRSRIGHAHTAHPQLVKREKPPVFTSCGTPPP